MPAFASLVRRFDDRGVQSIVLMGSHARGTAGPFSDVDLVRFTGKDTELDSADGSYLIDGDLVVVSTVRPATIEEWFTKPDVAVQVISGLRSARPLLDRNDVFDTVQRRANAFRWDAAMEARADRWVSLQMVGCSEEAHKGLEGLRRNDVGRLLNARFGCSWLMSRILCVHKGVLLSGDNALYDELVAVMGANSRWTRLRRTAFGLEDEAGTSPTLRAQVIAGLRLYALTADLVDDAIQDEHRSLVRHTVQHIEEDIAL